MGFPLSGYAGTNGLWRACAFWLCASFGVGWLRNAWWKLVAKKGLEDLVPVHLTIDV